MKVLPKNLHWQYPRSPRDTLGGYVHLSRMIDKARSKKAGTLGEYIYPCPMDQSLLEFFELSGDRFFRVVIERDDQEILQWLIQTAAPHKPEEIENWNQSLLSRKPEDQEGMARFLKIKEEIAPKRKDISSWVDLIDCEEGRSNP